MKLKMFSKHTFVTLSVLLVSLLVVMNVSADSKSYYGLTTVTYNGRVTDLGGWNWNGGWRNTTSPSYQMDQFGANYWSTWDSCDYVQDPNTIASLSRTYLQFVSEAADGMAQLKIQCPAGQILSGHAYVQHWWQDGGYSGDGGTTYTLMNLTNP